MTKNYTTVGRVEIKDFGPPIKLEVYGHPEQVVKRGQQVEVRLPDIFYEGKKLPALVFELRVMRQRDERTMLDFQQDVYEMIPEYLDFWESAKKEIEEKKTFLL